jgi:hypothetical protein
VRDFIASRYELAEHPPESDILLREKIWEW